MQNSDNSNQTQNGSPTKIIDASADTAIDLTAKQLPRLRGASLELGVTHVNRSERVSGHPVGGLSVYHACSNKVMRPFVTQIKTLPIASPSLSTTVGLTASGPSRHVPAGQLSGTSTPM